MRNKKARKPRGIGLDGVPSYDLCTGCYAYNCDPFMMSQKFRDMVDERRKAGVCVACGHNPCTCKSSLSIPRKEIKIRRRSGYKYKRKIGGWPSGLRQRS